MILIISLIIIAIDLAFADDIPNNLQQETMRFQCRVRQPDE